MPNRNARSLTATGGLVCLLAAAALLAPVARVSLLQQLLEQQQTWAAAFAGDSFLNSSATAHQSTTAAAEYDPPAAPAAQPPSASLPAKLRASASAPSSSNSAAPSAAAPAWASASSSASLPPPPAVAAVPPPKPAGGNAATSTKCQALADAVAYSGEPQPSELSTGAGALAALRRVLDCFGGAPGATVVVPLHWWMQARQAAFAAWYGHVFDVWRDVDGRDGAAVPPGDDPAHPRRVINASVVFPRRTTNTRYGSTRAVAADPGRAATAGGILVAPSVYLSGGAFAVRLAVGPAAVLAQRCTAAQHAWAPECDAPATWAPGYAVDGVAPALPVAPAVAAAPAAGLTGSTVWDVVALRAYACEETLRRACISPRGAAAWLDTAMRGRPPPLPNCCAPNATNVTGCDDHAAPAAPAPPADSWWVSHGCLVAAQDALTALPVVSGPIARLYAASFAGVARGAALLALTGSGHVPARGQVHTQFSGDPNSLVLRTNLSADAGKSGAFLLIENDGSDVLRWPPFGPSRALSFVDAVVALSHSAMTLLRRRRRRAGPPPPGSGLAPGDPEYDTFFVEDCISGLKYDTSSSKFAVPDTAWKDIAAAATRQLDASPVGRVPLLAPLNHVYSHANIFHAFEASSPMFVSASYARASDGFVYGLQAYNHRFFGQFAQAAGFGFARTLPELRAQWTGVNATASGKGGGSSLPSPSWLPARPATAASLQMVKEVPDDMAVAADVALAVEGPHCQWPSTLGALLGREVLRARARLPLVDGSLYWPEEGALPLSGRVGREALDRARRYAPPPREAATPTGASGAFPMTPAAVALGCPAGLPRRLRLLVVHRSVKRPLGNEGELMGALLALHAGGAAARPAVYNFSDAALPPLEEALAAFGNSDAVIAPHGAGLTHTVAMPPGAALFEFATFKFRYYAIAAVTLGLEHHFWEGPPRRDETVPLLAPVAEVTRAYCAFLAKRFPAG